MSNALPSCKSGRLSPNVIIKTTSVIKEATAKKKVASVMMVRMMMMMERRSCTSTSLLLRKPCMHLHRIPPRSSISKAMSSYYATRSNLRDSRAVCGYVGIFLSFFLPSPKQRLHSLFPTLHSLPLVGDRVGLCLLKYASLFHCLCLFLKQGYVYMYVCEM